MKGAANSPIKFVTIFHPIVRSLAVLITFSKLYVHSWNFNGNKKHIGRAENTNVLTGRLVERSWLYKLYVLSFYDKRFRSYERALFFLQ